MEKSHINKISKAFEDELKDVDAALRRAALKAKEEAERLGTPYVVAELKAKNLQQQHAVVESKQ